MEDAYTQYLRRELCRERKRAEAYQQAAMILSVACMTLVCVLALYSGV